MSQSELLVGIVTYNRWKKLEHTLAECRRLGFTNILVVDNGSTDGTREYLSADPSIQHIFTEKNEGGSGGFNRVMRYFIEKTECRWLLTFDDDAYPGFPADPLLAFLRSDAHSAHSGYALRVTYPDGTLCEMNRPGQNILTRHPLRYRSADLHIDQSTGRKNVDFAGFVGLLLKRSTVRNAGAVSRHFFIYSDDTYYTLSLSRDIGPLLYCPDFALIHDCRRSSRRLANHDPVRLERDVVNKIVMIREYSHYKSLYIALYLARLIVLNPKSCVHILRAARKGCTESLAMYRNEHF